jgi:hypothetical protein
LIETLICLGKMPLRSMRRIVERENPVRCRTPPNRRSLSGTLDGAMRTLVSIRASGGLRPRIDEVARALNRTVRGCVNDFSYGSVPKARRGVHRHPESRVDV